jgi:two-component system sensor histidine kinase KdpD
LVVVVCLPALTVLLVGRRATMPLATPVLLTLTLVVLAAILGGLRVGLPAALIGGLVLNWFFTEPYGTLAVDDADQLVVLSVYLAVGSAVSLVVGVAARRTAEATRARAEAEALSTLAGAALADVDSLPVLLERIRRVFGVREVALLERDAEDWVVVEAVEAAGEASPDDAELRVQVSPSLALSVHGPELFGEDRRVLRSFAEAAAAALQGARLREQAASAAQFEAADRMRTALLAAVGHDLRSPLSGVKAAVSSLRQHDVTYTRQETEDLLATIEESADRLQNLVENLLDASRLEAGVVSAVPECVPLIEVLDRVLAMAGPDRIATELPDHLPDLRVDVGLAERVLANLVDNAIRHAPPGSDVLIRGSADGDWVCCDVVDHGPGVAEDLWQDLFAPFQRLGDRHPGGMGLGLSVARGLTEAIGGRLEPTTTPGGGLTMRLFLPAAEPADGPA